MASEALKNFIRVFKALGYNLVMVKFSNQNWE